MAGKKSASKPERKRTKPLHVMLTDQESAQLMKAAGDVGLSMSSYARQAILERIKR
jgi:hypothetical protein